ncbi:DUF1624 domain-containing protein [Duganella sp. BJB488]|uniref:DUF1624 domain-containing protein n=1 Tax=unclassified Duganella TaxID=2636909 RepID=UPI000E34614D|nr:MULTISPECIES: heparan-alpha-glucosaminide N-acetyltransferase domain-containing protein [unclassified Duganella]RFP09205.1 DUF1624 domain-containing protein [Duganella sp. BJB475]RFP13281.1 DUF1624 domain-containing protein [Duganella sp. BJB489]RFP17143.1 DUF1624 domain-containing protein [Duganella sp. BJB488]RFP25431.1 DUF1624 domain-containing protein [Duganella sp. BJB476]RFP31638.1 DUF1624 domain-containing protein [Duganella sp. BJB480]
MGGGAIPSMRGPRLASIDIMRGLVMMMMTVDHVRETFFLRWQVSDPMDVAQIDPGLFFSRLAAHFCAPMFVFLTGLSAWLYAHPASGPRPVTGFLVKRGLMLVALEISVIGVAWTGKIPPPVIYLQVIWVIGLAMIALTLLHRLPSPPLIGGALCIVFGHNLLTPIAFEPGSPAYIPWTILHDRGFLLAQGPLMIKVSYPLLPWIGVIVLGYATGPWYASCIDPARRQRFLMYSGIIAVLLFLMLRVSNFYGETLPWTAGETAMRTVMSFLNVKKYPPSLDFLLLTLGSGLVLLSRLETWNNRLLRGAANFGSAPLFYYVLHLYLLLILQKLLAWGLGTNDGNRYEFQSLWTIWLVSVLLLASLHAPVMAFARFKRKSTMAWVRYF